MTAKRYNKLSLNTLADAAEAHEKIDISNQDVLYADHITVIKRDGRKEKFQPSKMRNIVLWATEGKEWLADELIEDTEIKLHKEIHIKDMFQQLIVTAVNKISLLYPHWEDVSAKLLLTSIYKETYNKSIEDAYPSMTSVLIKGLEHKIYDKKSVESYSHEELTQIDALIDPSKDLLFNYKGLTTFFDKYCLNYSKTKKLELPQHSYMRVAMSLMINETDRIEKVADLYHAISNHEYTKATPIMLNALTPNQQLSSCVLNTLSDDSHNILDTGKNLGIYSKHKGGTALEISAMRAMGSYIHGTQGTSSGPVPFMKFYERIMRAWNQGGKRAGACCVYFNWWHLDVFSILSLKSNGGTDENRARGLQYAIKLNTHFINAVIDDAEITLFDPKDTPKLIGLYGEAFEEMYAEYSTKSIRKTKIRARELWTKIFKERSETGNVYLFHDENVNEVSMLNRYIGSSNLCLSGETLVKTIYGNKQLRSIEVGDMVKSYNVEMGREEFKEVTASALMNASASVMKITDRSSRLNIICTPDHEIFTLNRGYVRASGLLSNDKLLVGGNVSANTIKIEYLKDDIAVYDITVKDNHNFFANDILVHNCTEIVLPSVPSESISEKLYTMEDGEKRIVKEYTAGEIALCNLSSVNLERWFYMDDTQKTKLIRTLVRALDNTIDVANYPVKEGKNSNMMYRYLGVGVLNYTNYLALNKIVIDSDEAMEETDALFDDLSYRIIKASMELAIEKGKFPKFHETEWSKGVLPIHKSNKRAFDLTSYEPDWVKWETLAQDVKRFGLRNAQLMAIAPTACQTKDSVIRTDVGKESLEELMNRTGVDHVEIEKVGVTGWHKFNESIEVPTRFGNKKSTRIWYNGKHLTRTLTFDDGNDYTFTLNHKLLVKYSQGTRWVMVGCMTEDMVVSGYTGTITKITDNQTLKHTWDIEVNEVHEYYLGNGCVSHNTSGKGINAIESTEPIHDFFYKEEGTITVPTVVPNFKLNNQYYKKAFDCDQYALLRNAAVRQKWIDQAQSVNLYISKPDSLLEMSKLHIYYFSLGGKTLYYLKQQKTGNEEICESCT